MNGDNATASRELAPALTGRETADSDPSIVQQWSNEIEQATNYVETQMCRLRNWTDLLVGSQPTDSPGIDKGAVAEVRPLTDVMASSINSLHHATQLLEEQMSRLEGHRLV